MDTLSAPRFSPFFGLMIVLIALATWFTLQVLGVQEKDRATMDDMSRLLPEAQQAIVVDKRYSALMNDLGTLAKTDPKAAQIVAEFKTTPSSNSSNSGDAAP